MNYSLFPFQIQLNHLVIQEIDDNLKTREQKILQHLVRSPAVALQREMCGHHYMSWCQLARSFCMLKQGQVMMAAAATASPSGPSWSYSIN